MLKPTLEILNQKWSALSGPGKALAGALALLVVAIPVLWSVDKILMFFFARSYVTEIATTFNFDTHLAQAVSLVVWIVIVYFISKLFSLSKANRRIGLFGLIFLLVAHGLLLSYGSHNQFFEASGKATKCYVLTREGEVRYLEHPGVDPVTGRTCRTYTQETIERLQAYARGKRPERVLDPAPEFFDLRTGEPIVWYHKDRTGRIELFNFMGFHPESGEELQPINAEVIAAYETQLAAQNEEAQRKMRPPQRIENIDEYELFDRATGRPRVWFWRDPNGDYEFFDNQGFHPSTGETLKQFTSDEITRWKRENQLAKEYKEQEEKKRLDQERLRKEAEERRLERERQLAEIARQAEEERNMKIAEAVARCDQLAANPHDPRKPSGIFGAKYADVKNNAQEGAAACGKAMKYFPDEPRYQYQYARAMGFIKQDEAILIYSRLTKLGYPAAFDNLASLLLKRKDRKSIKQALAILKEGVRAGDPDSMVTLADLVGTDEFAVQNPMAVKLALLKRAGELGDEDAREAAAELEQEMQQQQQQYMSQQQQEQMMMELFGAIMGGVLRAR